MNIRHVACLALLFIGGCGFQLQGRTPLPAVLAVTYVQAGDGQSDFVQSLRKSLLASGSRLVESRRRCFRHRAHRH